MDKVRSESGALIKARASFGSGKNITINKFQGKVYVHLFGKAGKTISLELDEYAKLVYMQDTVTEVAGELLKEVRI